MTDEDKNQTGATPPGKREGDLERDLLQRLAVATLEEQRKRRRWGIFFKGFFAAYLVLVLILIVADRRGKPIADRYTGLVELEGVIMPDGGASADQVIAGLREAFEDKRTAGIILRANSPGGSPVQSAYINDEIRRLREKYPKKPIYSVVSDVCASGCYYAVVATERIYANPSSIIGSIGVLMNGFGFVDTLKKLGVERRLITAGERKGFLDPFSPMDAGDRRHAKELLGKVHAQFIKRVREGRGKALKDSRDVFSGLFWTGEDAKKMGLVDEFGSAGSVARDVIGADEIVDFTYREDFFERFARRVGSSMAQWLTSRGAHWSMRLE